MLTKVKLIHIKFDNLIASCGASIDEKILTKVAPIKGYKGGLLIEFWLAAKGAIMELLETISITMLTFSDSAGIQGELPTRPVKTHTIASIRNK
jgi:hypothetical protein